MRNARHSFLLGAVTAGFGALVACSSSEGTSASPSSSSSSTGDGGPVERTNDGGLPNAPGATDGGAASDGSAGGACGNVPAPWTDPGAAPPVPDPKLAGQTHEFYKITVVDQNGAPVVGATLSTTNSVNYTTDVNGNVAYYEPGLMGATVWLGVSCDGYTYSPTDFAGNVGSALNVTEGGSVTLTMTKTGTVTPPDVGDLQTRLLAGNVPGAAQCFAIRMADSVTSRGVPLVELTPGAGAALWSDSQGMVAYCDPDHVGSSVTFTVASDGYALATGSQVTLPTVAGGSQTVPLVRANPGERLYRVTGQGIYRDSVLLGLTTPVTNPNVNGLVMGQDTPFTFTYGGQLWWLWQDTDQVGDPIGNYRESGAVSPLPLGDGGLSPDLGSNQSYFVSSSGFARGMVDPTADPMYGTAAQYSPVWLGGPVAVLDAQGQTQIYGAYYVAQTDGWSALAKLDPTSSIFDYVADFTGNATYGTGRSTLVNDVSGVMYAYWNNPARFPATVAGVTNLAGYEVFSAYGPNGSTTLARNADGTLAYAWAAGATPVTPAALTAAKIGTDQAIDGHLTDMATGDDVVNAADSAMWNDYRKRYSNVIEQAYGSTSYIGESWYAEGDTPFGPWVYARKVVTHDDYSFYNPDIVPYFSEAGGRIVFFDATYTNKYTTEPGSSSCCAPPTPWYDYNEVMYRLDLDDPRLVLPVAVYERVSGSAQDLRVKQGVRPSDPYLAPSFYAYDRPATGAVPVAWNGAACGARRLVVGGQPATTPLFYALPSVGSGGGDAGNAGGPATVPLYEYAGPSGAYVYSVNAALQLSGFQRGAAVASVWPTPVSVAMPVADFLGDLVADAGPDQCVSGSGDAGASVTLDASASRDLSGPITKYSWIAASTGCPIASGVTATVSLPPGVNDVLLETTDAAGNASTDEVVIAVD